jgi:hypothetical protein
MILLRAQKHLSMGTIPLEAQHISWPTTWLSTTAVATATPTAPQNAEMTTSQQGQSSELLELALEKLGNVKIIMNRKTVMQTADW